MSVVPTSLGTVKPGLAGSLHCRHRVEAGKNVGHSASRSCSKGSLIFDGASAATHAVVSSLKPYSVRHGCAAPERHPGPGYGTGETGEAIIMYSSGPARPTFVCRVADWLELLSGSNVSVSFSA